MSHLNTRQFLPPGDADAKQALIDQLGKDFPEPALAWLSDPAVRVEPAQRVDPSRVDWDGYSDWRASRQLKDVVKTAKKIDKGKHKKPAVMVQPPGTDALTIIDGHHKTLAAIEAKKNPRTFVVHVPEATGEWQTMHDQQIHDKHKDDFGKTIDANK